MGWSNRVRLLAGFAIGLAFIAEAHADPSPTITIGDLTFSYEPASWHMAADGDRLVATCLQLDCRGAVIDISRRDGEAGCTQEAMVAEAERLFPVPGRAYANVLRAGRFALVLAERHDGPELSSPAFVHGCVAWQGSEYRFAMRPETVGTQSWIGGALHYLVSRASAPAARVESVRLGDVEFRVSTDQWSVSDVAPGENLRLVCRMPTCDEPGLAVALSVKSLEQPCPAPDADEMLYEAETMTEVLSAKLPGGLDFMISKTFLGCRNYVPPRVRACAIYNGRSYHLSTLVGLSCRASVWNIPESALLDLLHGARIAKGSP